MFRVAKQTLKNNMGDACPLFCYGKMFSCEVFLLNYKESSYYKLFRFAFIVIISVLLFLGVIVISVSARVFKNSKLKDLESDGKLFIKCLEDEYGKSENILSDSIQKLHFYFSNEYKLKIYFYDKDGECIFSASDYNEELLNELSPYNNLLKPSDKTEPLSGSVKKAVDGKDKRYLDMDSSSLSKNEPYLIYGTKTVLRHDKNESAEKIYILFCAKTDSINKFTQKMIIFYMIFALITAYLSYVMLKRRMKKLTAYEYDFLRISERYAKNDFTEKLSTDIDGIPKMLTEYINVLASNVENSEDVSKTFIANVSHELRTPMTTIGGFVSGIIDGTIPKSKQNEYLILVNNEIKRLKILISSMLNMTKFESGTMTPNFSETNLTDLVIQTVLMFEKKIEAKKLEVEGLDSDRLIAVADADLIQQVIYNLVENAVKFINIGGTLSFRIEKNDSMNEIAVRNTGEGLTDLEIQQVFDRFYKTDSSRGKDATGLGLGLSISRKIAHLHKGHIVVKSVYGEYTEFIVQIPDLKKRES